ncbi:hypothetical protein RCL1_005576 [Eukaryota sp. TZLM3-RCL]
MNTLLQHTPYFITSAHRSNVFDASCSPLCLSGDGGFARIQAVEADCTLWRLIPLTADTPSVVLQCVDMMTPSYLTSSLGLSENKEDACVWNISFVPSCRPLSYTVSVELTNPKGHFLASKRDNSVAIIDSTEIDATMSEFDEEFIYTKVWNLVPEIPLKDEDVFPKSTPLFVEDASINV